jgi:hypothetical protein
MSLSGQVIKVFLMFIIGLVELLKIVLDIPDSLFIAFDVSLQFSDLSIDSLEVL